MKRIIEPIPNYLNEMVVDYISLINSTEEVTLFSHSFDRNKIFGITHYDLIYDTKNNLTKMKLRWEGARISVLNILMSKV